MDGRKLVNEYQTMRGIEDSKKEKKYEMVNHPSHYKNYDVETIEMINRIWGAFAASQWSELNAFKYRMRVGTKPNNPIEQDFNKEKVYLNFVEKYDEIWMNQTPQEIVSNLTDKEKQFILKVCDYIKN